MEENSLEDIKSRLVRTKTTDQPLFDKGLSTGSTLLNLACTGRPEVGFVQGNYYFLVGDSSSGKTFWVLTCLAEASLNKNYNKHRFIFDNAENGALMDIGKYFGPSVASRLEPPEGTKKDPVYSSTVEALYYHLDDAFKANKPFIYILDSMDALTTDDEEDKFKENKTAYDKGKKDTAGTYGTSKAKQNSYGLRVVFNKLRVSESILLILSQTRDNIGFGSQYQPKTRSGGWALTFYCALELWTSIQGHITKTVKGKSRELGIHSKVRVKKNRLTGRDRTVVVPIYHSAGIDDVGGCVNYLIEEGHWEETKGGVITASEFEFSGKPETLIHKIEKDNREEELRQLVGEVWDAIEDACSVNRKGRYSEQGREDASGHL